MANKGHIAESIQHLAVGFVLTLKGFEKLHHHPMLGGLILAFGVLALGYTVYEKATRKDSFGLKVAVHVFEALACWITAYIFFQDGKSYLPYTMLGAGIGFMISVVIMTMKHRKRAAVAASAAH